MDEAQKNKLVEIFSELDMRYNQKLYPYSIFFVKKNKIYFELYFYNENEFKNFLINYRFSQNVPGKNDIYSDMIDFCVSHEDVLEFIYAEYTGNDFDLQKELKLLAYKYLKINLEEHQVKVWYSDFEFKIDDSYSLSVLPKIV